MRATDRSVTVTRGDGSEFAPEIARRAPPAKAKNPRPVGQGSFCQAA